MSLSAQRPRITIQEYLARESQASDRHEFHDGEILAMAGGTYQQSKISVNVGRELSNRLRGGPCEPLDRNMRVRIFNRASYVYPDFTVICGPPEFDRDDSKQTTIINPRVVLEVLSDSTESYDRGGKFDLYRQIPSLEEYVLISQHQPLVETFLRQSDGSWVFNAWKGTQTAVRLRTLQITVPLAEIYSDIEFNTPP